MKSAGAYPTHTDPKPKAHDHGEATLVERLLRSAEAQPDRLAYAYLPEISDEAQKISYGELVSRARTTAAALARRVQPDPLGRPRAILLFPAGLEFLVSFFACTMARVIAIPVAMTSPKRPQYLLENVATNSSATIVLTTSAMIESVKGCLEATQSHAGMTVATLEELEGENLDFSLQLPDQKDIAFIQYTSGSTGFPKGVVVRHENIIANHQSISECMQIGPEETVVSWLPHNHDMGLIGGLLSPIYARSECWFMSPTSFLKRPLRWLQLIASLPRVISGSPNFGYDQCTTRIGEVQETGLDLSGWYCAYNGAETVRAATIDRFVERFSAVGFRRSSFLPCYGMAEVTLFAAGAPAETGPVYVDVERTALERGKAIVADPAAPPAEGNRQRLVSSGRVWPHQRIVIANPETGEQLDDGLIGEVWTSGPHISDGYWERPDANAETFGVKLSGDSQSPGFLRTGDLGFCLDGEVFITGRRKEMIIVAGRNLFPDDLEAAVETCHDGIQDVAILSVDTGEARERILALVELSTSSRRLLSSIDGVATLNEIRENMQLALSHRFDIALDHVIFGGPGAIPKTTSGKTRYNEVRKSFVAIPAQEREPMILRPARG